MPQPLFILLPALLAAFAAPGPLAGPAAAQQAAMAGSAPRPVQTGYMVVEAAEVPVTLLLTGRAVAQNTTRIRPRVGGVVTAILYTPGTLVAEGAPLFAIDPTSHEIALASAEADLAQAEAELTSAQTAFERAARLREGATASVAAFEQAEAVLLKARAARGSAEADLALARLQLEWTTVRAPISGVVGIAEVSIGDLVSASQSDALAEIVQTDPVQIDLTEPYPMRLRIDARAGAGEITLDETPTLSLFLGPGIRTGSDARLVSTGATVSSTTGTRRLRFEMANPEGLIAPGMFLHAELTLGRESAVLVPQRATERQRDGSLTAWVAVNGKAERRRLTETGTFGNDWVVRAGLDAGEWLLLDGISTLRDGQDVSPVLATIDAAGVVRDSGAAATGPASN
ncbi:efflux RND transporter periplasmic adaptor subunit [Pseudogemmobacter sonorensis]|uniref:efflux RND transporter periplasmic adaptor subunit n=1 Tax=Pseudogemmobacter sonorensis TaxID=2989681 RepID=UPI0036A491BF